MIKRLREQVNIYTIILFYSLISKNAQYLYQYSCHIEIPNECTKILSVRTLLELSDILFVGLSHCNRLIQFVQFIPVAVQCVLHTFGTVYTCCQMFIPWSWYILNHFYSQRTSRGLVLCDYVVFFRVTVRPLGVKVAWLYVLNVFRYVFSTCCFISTREGNWSVQLNY